MGSTSIIWRRRRCELVIDKLLRPLRKVGRKFNALGQHLGQLACGRMLSARKISSTKLFGYPKAEFSIHMLSCHRHVEMSLWALKSFSYYARLSPSVFVHDDGTLTTDDVACFNEHIAHCSVVRRAQADVRIREILKDHPHCRDVRFAQGHPLPIKLFDAWAHAPHDVFILMDSDVLFFRRPEELLNHAANGRACFSADCQDAYAATTEELRAFMGVDVMPAVNSGLLAIGRSDFDLDLSERFFQSLPSARYHGFSEQTAWAVILSNLGAKRLSRAYQISSRTSVHSETVSNHYVSDGYRLRFWTTGVRLLKERGDFDDC